MTNANVDAITADTVRMGISGNFERMSFSPFYCYPNIMKNLFNICLYINKSNQATSLKYCILPVLV